VAKRQTKRQTKSNPPITPDAFLEAVLDSEGSEDMALEILEVKAKALHAWMNKNEPVVELAKAALEERDVDTTDVLLGWLSTKSSLKTLQTDTSDWAKYRDLLLEETVIEAKETLIGSLERTNSLLEQLASEKRAKQAAKKPKLEFQDYD
jgi:IS1 family transposase